MRIELENVGVDWQGRRILDGVNLCLEPGRTLGVLGASGSGVSLLLKTAAGLLDPSTGRVLYDGIDVRSLDEEQRRRLQTRTGFMFQDAALWANTNLEGNLLLPLRARHLDWGKSRLREHMNQALARIGFTADLSQRPDRISFGQQRFVSFLRAVVPGPQALFLDEPHNSMDGHWIRVLDEETERLRTQGTSLFLGGHHPAGWCARADELAILDRGRIVLSGTPTAVRASSLPEVTELFAVHTSTLTLSSGEQTNVSPEVDP